MQTEHKSRSLKGKEYDLRPTTEQFLSYSMLFLDGRSPLCRSRILYKSGAIYMNYKLTLTNSNSNSNLILFYII